MVIKSSATCETTTTRNWIKATTDVLLEVRKEGCFDLNDGGQLIVKQGKSLTSVVQIIYCSYY